MHRGSLARRAGLKHSVNHGANLACPLATPQRFFAAHRKGPTRVGPASSRAHAVGWHSTIHGAVVVCSMAKKRAPELANSPKGNASETLDSLNAQLRRKSNAIRRSMEAGLEEDARKRRTSEAPASSAWKR